MVQWQLSAREYFTEFCRNYIFKTNTRNFLFDKSKVAEHFVVNAPCYGTYKEKEIWGKAEYRLHIQGVPGVKVTSSGFNFRADSESKTSYTWVQLATAQELNF